MTKPTFSLRLGSGLMGMFLMSLLTYLKINNHMDVPWVVVFLPVLIPLVIGVCMLSLVFLGVLLKAFGSGRRY